MKVTQSAMEFLHKYNDGSCLYRMSARAICRVPIWKGNRIMDMTHVQQLKQSIGEKITTLDSGYKIIRYTEEEEKGEMVKKSYIVDGQHRIHILQDAFTTMGPEVDFIVTVTEIELASEDEAIRYFNQINHAKPISYTEDERMIVNRYLEAILRIFDSKLRLIRQGATRRPYLSSDRLREQLIKQIHFIRNLKPSNLAIYCQEVNLRLIENFKKDTQQNTSDKDRSMKQKMIELDFGLAWDDKWKWLSKDSLEKWNRTNHI